MTLVSFSIVSFDWPSRSVLRVGQWARANNTSDDMNMLDRSSPSANEREFDAVDSMISVVLGVPCCTSMWRTTRMDKYK